MISSQFTCYCRLVLWYSHHRRQNVAIFSFRWSTSGVIFHTAKLKLCCLSSKDFLRTEMEVLTEKSCKQTKCKVDKLCKRCSAGLLGAFLLVLCLQAHDDEWSWEINILTFWEPRYIFCGEAWSHLIRLWNHDLLSQRARKLLKRKKKLEARVERGLLLNSIGQSCYLQSLPLC